MTAFHAVLGGLLIAVNVAAGALGAYHWWRATHSRAFWPLLRGGQALVVLQALDGLVLVALGHDLPELHLIYGLTPLGVSFVAEQLRLASADTVLGAHGLEGSAGMAPAAGGRAARDSSRDRAPRDGGDGLVGAGRGRPRDPRGRMALTPRDCVLFRTK